MKKTEKCLDFDSKNDRAFRPHKRPEFRDDAVFDMASKHLLLLRKQHFLWAAHARYRLLRGFNPFFKVPLRGALKRRKPA